MKLVIIGVGALAASALIGALFTTPMAAAPGGAAAAATQHALDELANCRAQRRPECPTQTTTPTVPASATPTLIPTSMSTDVPTDPPEPTVTPLPVLPAPPPGDDPARGYTRPHGNGWLELALSQGRWAVYQADDCAAVVEAWRQAWLTSADDGEVDLNASGSACGLVAAVWQSDAPCALDDQGVCQLVLDASYWDMLGRTPTAVPSETPTLRPPATPNTARPAAPAPASPSQVEVHTVVQTVVVVVTAVPNITPGPVATLTAPPTRTPMAIVTPTRSPTVTLAATGTPTLELAAAVATPAGAAGESVSHVTGSATGRWEWSAFFKVAALVVVLGGLAIWALTRRTVVRWGARPNSSGGGVHPHA